MAAKATLIVAGVFFVGCLAWVGLTGWMHSTFPPVETNKTEMALTQKRLAPLLPEFDALHDPTGTTPSPATIGRECEEDSGELLGQPEVSRRWDVPTGRTSPVARQLAKQLTATGWAPKPGGRFTRHERGWSITAKVTQYAAITKTYPSDVAEPASVFVSAQVDGATPCSQGT